MVIAVLGAPGSGKSELVQPLRVSLPGYIVFDWDAWMEPASAVAGRDVRHSPSTWPAYRDLVRAFVDAACGASVVMLTVCTPDELGGWPIRAWVLLDCDDTVRTDRLAPRRDPEVTRNALADAAQYRALGLPTIDTTAIGPEHVAGRLAQLVRQFGANAKLERG